jgi:hypothetical protein
MRIVATVALMIAGAYAARATDRLPGRSVGGDRADFNVNMYGPIVSVTFRF